MSAFDRRSHKQRQNDDAVVRSLGGLQAEVMTVFWDLTDATVREALDEMNKNRHKALAYTTLLTVTTRLWQRGLLGRERDGRGFRYRPLRTRTELLSDLSDQLIDRLLDDFGDIAVARIGERLERLDPVRLAKLEEIRMATE